MNEKMKPIAYLLESTIEKSVVLQKPQKDPMGYYFESGGIYYRYPHGSTLQPLYSQSQVKEMLEEIQATLRGRADGSLNYNYGLGLNEAIGNITCTAAKHGIKLD